MGTDQIMYCIVALILGMLLASMFKNVCGCKNVVEGLCSAQYPYEEGCNLTQETNKDSLTEAQINANAWYNACKETGGRVAINGLEQQHGFHCTHPARARHPAGHSRNRLSPEAAVAAAARHGNGNADVAARHGRYSEHHKNVEGQH